MCKKLVVFALAFGLIAGMARADLVITNGDFEADAGAGDLENVSLWYDDLSTNFWESAWQSDRGGVTPNGTQVVVFCSWNTVEGDPLTGSYIYQSIGTSSGESSVTIGFDWGHPDDVAAGRLDGITIAAYASDGTTDPNDDVDINGAEGVTLLDSASYSHVAEGTDGEIFPVVVTLDLSGANAGDEIFLRFNNYMPEAGADPWPVLDNVQITSEPAPTTPFSLGAVEDIELGNDPQTGPESNSNGSGLGARDIPDRRRVILISYDISSLMGRGPVSNVSFSHFSHDQHGEVNVYGVIEDLDLLEVESLTWNTAPGVQNDPTPELNSPVALDPNDLTDALLTFVGPGETGLRFSTDTSQALADFINADTDGILTFLIAPSAEGNQLIIRARTHAAGGTLLEGELPLPVDPGTDGLIAYYTMENDANDSSGNGLNGTILGDPNFVEGYEGMALDLDGDGDYVDCGYDPLFDVTTNEITVSAWVTIRSIANQWAAIAAKGEYAWRLGNASLDPRFHFGITIWNAPDTASIDGVTAVGFDEWHHVAGMFDGSNIMVYLDGVLDVSVATTEPIGVNDKSMLIGNNPDDPVRYWDGLIDELKIYDRALSEGEVRYLASIPEPIMLDVENFSFELPGTGKQKCWDGENLNSETGDDPNDYFEDVPGWSNDTAAADSGVEGPDAWPGNTEGVWAGYMMGTDPSIYNLLNYDIKAGDNYVLSVDVRDNWTSDAALPAQLQMTLYYEADGVRVPVATQAVELTTEWATFALPFSADDIPESIGNMLGIELKNASNATADNNSWIGMDNVLVSVSPN